MPFISGYRPYKVSRFSCARYSRSGQNVSWDLLSCDWLKRLHLYIPCAVTGSLDLPLCAPCALVDPLDLRLNVPCAVIGSLDLHMYVPYAVIG